MKAVPRSIYNRLREKGLSRAQVCGVLGNIQQESGFETDALGFDDTGSFGLCQWLGPRKSSLARFAHTRKESASDWRIQIEFLWQELITTERKALQKLQMCETPREAAVSFSRHFERPHPRWAHNNKRAEYAEHWFREFAPK